MRIFSRCAVALALSWSGWAGAADPVTVEGTVDADVGQVWKAFSTSEGLRSWLAPLADIDLRLDGLMRSNDDARGALGDAGTIVNQVLAFEPRRMLALKVAQPPQDFPFPHAVKRMWTVISFEAAGARRTRLRVVSLGFGDDDESLRMRAFFERGNAATLRQLQDHFAPAGAGPR